VKRSPLSAKELEARRANARESTGPRTATGKAGREFEIRIRDFNTADPECQFPGSGDGPRQNKPNWLNILPVNRIGGFEAKQTQYVYLLFYQSDREKFGSFLEKYECERSIKDSRRLLSFWHDANFRFRRRLGRNKPNRLNICPVN
jgi:hypothetical protein